VLPLNPKETVGRVMRRFRLPWDAHVTISSTSRTTLPTGSSVAVNDVLGAYVELSQPATRRGILALAELAQDPAAKTALTALAAPDEYAAAVAGKRVSVLDLLERFPTVDLPFATFLGLLPPMRVRQYSISSSPLWNPRHCTLTFSLLDSPSMADPAQRHVGVASSYLASLSPGDTLHVAVRPSNAAFHPPADAERVPVICICAGTGLAPFRGFMQERAAQIAAGRDLAPALLFFGCRGQGLDDLYRAEMDRWEALGAVSIRRAYSRVDHPDSKGCKHVQDRLWHDREEVVELWDNGAKVYVCGSREVGAGVKDAVIRMCKESTLAKHNKELADDVALKWFDGIKNERYATDVFD
jgi:cytochrome P450/NADPH-cytochrome P450 reductase